MAPDPLGGWAARGAEQRGEAAGGTYAKAKLVKRETKGREEGGTGDKGRQRRDGKGVVGTLVRKGRANSTGWNVMHASEGG